MPPHTMDEEMAMTMRMMTDDTPIFQITTVRTLWLELAAVQLAWRVPGLSAEMKDVLRDIGDQMAVMIIDLHPEAEALILMGWNPDKDVTRAKQD